MSRENHLRFSSQNLPNMDNASEGLIERAFDNNQIGMYAQLWISDDVFIQAGSRGSPSTCRGPADDPLVRELGDFIQRTGSEPWTLEYIDGVARKEYQA